MNKLQTLITATVIALGCAGASSIAEADECGPGRTVYATFGDFSRPSLCGCGDDYTGFVTGLVTLLDDNQNYALRFQVQSPTAPPEFEVSVDVYVTYDDGHSDWVRVGSAPGGAQEPFYTNWHVDGGHVEEPYPFRATCRLN